MSVVIDASVLVAVLTDPGDAGKWATQVLTDTHHAVAPSLILVETTNVLRRLERSKQLSPAEAAAAQQDLLRVALELVPYEPFASRVWELRHTLTSYDAWYVAIAEILEAPLATLDLRLSRAVGPRCRFLTPRP